VKGPCEALAWSDAQTEQGAWSRRSCAIDRWQVCWRAMIFQDCPIKRAERSAYSPKLGKTVSRNVEGLPASDVYLRRWLAPRMMTERKSEASRDHQHPPQSISNSIATFFTAFAYSLRLRGQESLDVSKVTLRALINCLFCTCPPYPTPLSPLRALLIPNGSLMLSRYRHDCIEVGSTCGRQEYSRTLASCLET
jgi:hypothetical protein